MSTNQPLACDFTAIEEGQREQHRNNAEQLFMSVEKWEEISNGYAFRIPTDSKMIQKAGAFMAYERLCCPFFHFNLDVSPEKGSVWLKITGNNEVKSYIKQTIIPQLESDQNGDWQLPDNAITSN